MKQIDVREIDGLSEAVAAAAGGADDSNNSRLGASLTKYGVVIALGTSGQPDEAITESPTILRDPKSGKYVMAYVGYDTTPRARACWATSSDLLTWSKQGALLAHSGTSGAPDQNGVTGPLLLWDNDNGQYVLYYIGLTATGYEGGTKTICMATATSLSGTWTRHGAVITTGSGWRANAVWHPSVVERNGTWYMFFNASNGSDVEQIGYASAPAITGPWTVDDTNSPIIAPATGWEDDNVGDPSVRRIGDMWVMDYYGYDGAPIPIAADGIAVCPDSAFPIGPWTKYAGNPVLSPGASYDAKYAHKPFVMTEAGVLYHFYTAVSASDVRQIAVATEGLPAAPTSLTVQDENGNISTAVTQIDFQGAGVTATAGTGEVVVTIPGSSSSGTGELLMQDGVTGPPVPIETEARDDWLYSD